MIKYDIGKKRVKQELESISLYELEGEIGKVIEDLQGNYERLKSQKSRKITEISYASKGAYLDGATIKEVSFDNYVINIVHDKYDGDEQYLAIFGERDFLPEELVALEKQVVEDKLRQKERDLKLLENLKKQYGDT